MLNEIKKRIEKDERVEDVKGKVRTKLITIFISANVFINNKKHLKEKHPVFVYSVGRYLRHTHKYPLLSFALNEGE